MGASGSMHRVSQENWQGLAGRGGGDTRVAGGPNRKGCGLMSRPFPDGVSLGSVQGRSPVTSSDTLLTGLTSLEHPLRKCEIMWLLRTHMEVV